MNKEVGMVTIISNVGAPESDEFDAYVKVKNSTWNWRIINLREATPEEIAKYEKDKKRRKARAGA
jgi:hypothetical protein